MVIAKAWKSIFRQAFMMVPFFVFVGWIDGHRREALVGEPRQKTAQA
jgi:hypothetical protein